ncbi:MAG: prepilin-type N-terminal cleavage/methylation domain-containing protein [Aureliella sp.]
MRTKRKQATVSRSRGNRSAFTLLEIMLVLTIIVVVGAIAVPAISETLQRQKLRSAVGNLRVRLDEARMEALRTGQAQVFSCELETSSFSVQPLMLQSDAMSAGPGATIVTGGAMVETDQNGIVRAAEDTVGESETLDDEIIFHSCMVAGDARAFSTATQAQASIGSVNDLAITNVAQRVIFYPDGSTSTAEVQIRNSRGDVRAVQIRGITGHTRVLDVSNVAWGDEE